MHPPHVVLVPSHSGPPPNTSTSESRAVSERPNPKGMHEAVGSASSPSKGSATHGRAGSRPRPPPTSSSLSQPRTSTRATTPNGEVCTATSLPNAVDSAAKGLADALRVFVRDALHQELTGLKDELLHAIRASRLHSGPTPQRTRRASFPLWRSPSASGAPPQPSANGSRTGYLPAVALGPAGRKYGLRWCDVEASLARRKKREIAVDADAEASQILASARARATRRRGA
jgi:hypothetical protein